jgi:DNA segregation ATPase FtsK/SpoIIIE-like protein
MASSWDQPPLLPGSLRAKLAGVVLRLLGYAVLAACIAGAASLLTWSVGDPSYMRPTDAPARNLLGQAGATFADLTLRLFGLAGVFILLPPMFWALQLITRRRLQGARSKLMLAAMAVLLLAAAASSLPRAAAWPIPFGLGGFLGDQALQALRGLTAFAGPERAAPAAGIASLGAGLALLIASLGLSLGDLRLMWRGQGRPRFKAAAWAWRGLVARLRPARNVSPVRREPTLDMPSSSSPEDHFGDWRAEPSLTRPVRPPPHAFASGDGKDVAQMPREGEFDRATDNECHKMARRFAPEPAAADDEANAEAPRLRLKSGRTGGITRRFSPFRPRLPARSPATPEGRAGQKPIWPGSVPAPPEDAASNRPHRRPPGEELYSRAVAIVRADRKASTEYLQQRLGIRYMSAADLIERMEQEGILGAPVRNGTRPILRRLPRTRIV